MEKKEAILQAYEMLQGFPDIVGPTFDQILLVTTMADALVEAWQAGYAAGAAGTNTKK